MKTVGIDEEVLDLVPEAFKNLEDVDYRLTKTENTRSNDFVSAGEHVTGPLTIVNVVGKPGVKVSSRSNGDITYLRTSPIVEVLDNTQTTVTFRTEGGVYRVERV